MKIRVIGTTFEILHFTKFLERSPDYADLAEPSEIYPINDGKDKGKYRCHYNVREVFRRKKRKKHIMR